MIRRMENLTIRSATREDAAVMHQMIEGLSRAMERESDYHATTKDYEQYGFGDDACFKTLLAFQGVEPVGIVIYFYEFSTWHGRPGVYIQDLYVNSSTRGSGVGQQLLQAVIQRALRRDACYMRLSVYIDNESAAGFYSKLGFEPAHDEVLFKLAHDSFRKLGAE